MIYRDVLIQSERGLPLAVACAFDFSGLDPTTPGATLVLTVRKARGDATAALELASTRREIVVSAPAEAGGPYVVALTATLAQMNGLPARRYVYGLAVSVPGYAPQLVVEGVWDHQGKLVDL